MLEARFIFWLRKPSVILVNLLAFFPLSLSLSLSLSGKINEFVEGVKLIFNILLGKINHPKCH